MLAGHEARHVIHPDRKAKGSVSAVKAVENTRQNAVSQP